MNKLSALIYLSEHALDSAKSHDELIAAYEATAEACEGLLPERAADARAMVERLHDMDRAQLKFRALLRDAALPSLPDGPQGRHTADSNGH